MPPINGSILSTSTSTPDAGRRALRADARRNRQQILTAARDVFVELGADAPLDEVARRAGVGIATLYRRFPDRGSLQRAVALDVLTQAGELAHQAEVEESDAWRALGRYMHAALDLRISAVMPALLGRVSYEDVEFTRAREEAVSPVLRILAAGRGRGELRDDIDFGDIGLFLVRVSRPLPGPFPPALDLAVAHRHLELFLAALRAAPPGAELGGPVLSLAELQAIAPRSPASD